MTGYLEKEQILALAEKLEARLSVGNRQITIDGELSKEVAQAVKALRALALTVKE